MLETGAMGCSAGRNAGCNMLVNIGSTGGSPGSEASLLPGLCAATIERCNRAPRQRKPSLLLGAAPFALEAERCATTVASSEGLPPPVFGSSPAALTAPEACAEPLLLLLGSNEIAELRVSPLRSERADPGKDVGLLDVPNVCAKRWLEDIVGDAPGVWFGSSPLLPGSPESGVAPPFRALLGDWLVDSLLEPALWCDNLPPWFAAMALVGTCNLPCLPSKLASTAAPCCPATGCCMLRQGECLCMYCLASSLAMRASQATAAEPEPPSSAAILTRACSNASSAF